MTMSPSSQPDIRWKPPDDLKDDTILGVPFYRLSREELVGFFRDALKHGNQARFSYLNIAVSNQASNDRQLFTLLQESELVYIDGAGISWGLRILGKGLKGLIDGGKQDVHSRCFVG